MARSPHLHPLGMICSWAPWVGSGPSYHTSGVLKNKSVLLYRGSPTVGPIQDNLIPPLNLLQWRILLANHPDTCFKDFIQKEIRWGFQIGYSQHKTLNSSDHNMPSKVPSFISEYLLRKWNKEEWSSSRLIKLPETSNPPLRIVPWKVETNHQPVIPRYGHEISKSRKIPSSNRPYCVEEKLSDVNFVIRTPDRCCQWRLGHTNMLNSIMILRNHGLGEGLL